MNPTVNIYMMTHGPTCAMIPECCIPMEIGAACRNNFKYMIRDNQGSDNISEKDKTYCELTGLYWIWKNDKTPISGLCHYRRIFKINKSGIIKNLKKYDIIVSKHCNVHPTLEEQYISAHIKSDWDTMINILSELYPEYIPTAKSVFNGKKGFFCNMFISERETLEKYCEWLFP